MNKYETAAKVETAQQYLVMMRRNVGRSTGSMLTPYLDRVLNNGFERLETMLNSILNDLKGPNGLM